MPLSSLPAATAPNSVLQVMSPELCTPSLLRLVLAAIIGDILAYLIFEFFGLSWYLERLKRHLIVIVKAPLRDRHRPFCTLLGCRIANCYHNGQRLQLQRRRERAAAREAGLARARARQARNEDLAEIEPLLRERRRAWLNHYENGAPAPPPYVPRNRRDQPIIIRVDQTVEQHSEPEMAGDGAI